MEEKIKRIRVRCYTMKEARFIMHFLMENGFEGVTNDSYRDCDLFAWSAFDSDGVCFVGIALLRGASMRVSNLHDSVARKDYVEVSKSKFISEITKFKQLLRKPWHDGDILVCKRYPNCYAVFKRYDVNDTFDAYFIYDNKNIYLDATAFTEAYRLASAKDTEGLPRLFSYLMKYLNDAGLCLPKKIEQTK